MSTRRDISPAYLNQPITSEPGQRLHRLFAMLMDTFFDDLTPERIAELEEHIASWRWMNASGERLDK